jgi:hypothetical protein
MEITMPRNEGKIDRLLRIVGGAAILSLYFVGPQSPWALLGLVPILTGLIGYCPAYSLIGVNTCARKA